MPAPPMDPADTTTRAVASTAPRCHPPQAPQAPRAAAAVRAGAAVALAGALTACTTGPGNGTGPSPTATGTATPTATPTGSPSPSPSPDVPPVAAVTADGEVVLLDLSSGDVTQVLLEGVDVRDPASIAVDVSPDGESVVVTRPSGGETPGDVVSVLTETGQTEVLASGWSPAVSPDGETLAYVVREEGTQEPAIVLQDLTSGQERTLRSGSGTAFVYIGELTWTADGSELVFMAGEISTGLHVVDADATSLAESRRLGPQDLDRSWRASAALDDGTLAVASSTQEMPPAEWTVVTVDVQDGEVLGEPLPVDRIEATALAVPAGRPGLLVVDGGGPDGGTLLHWDGADGLEEVAEDIISVGG